MVDIQALIQSILSNKKLSDDYQSSSKVYKDEPIIKRASQMAGHMPPMYREMRKIVKGYDVSSLSSARVFYQQGKLMEGFEDDFDYRGEFVRYFPTYQSMSDQQLRGYFSWRTKIRRGELPLTSTSFAFVYIYELLNLIGVGSPEEGFIKLKSFWSEYGKLDPYINGYVKMWLADFVVYYNLDKELLKDFIDVHADDAILILLQYQSHSADEVFAALNALSSYNFENSRFYKMYPKDVRNVVYGVFAELSEHYEKKCKNSLCERLFGRLYENGYDMFRSAVFYRQDSRKNYVYQINEIYQYAYKNGRWTCKRFFGYSGKNRQIGTLLKTVDFVMRQKYGFKSTLKATDTTKLLLDVINKVTDKYLDFNRKKSAPKIEIDVSKLRDIRITALETQNKLIVETDADEDKSEDWNTVDIVPLSEDGELFENNAPELSETERRFLYCLLYGGDYGELLKSGGVMLSVLADSVNDKLFDRFGDTVLDFDGDKPLLIEDYEDELKGIIKE